ncbi:hypothetical protein AM493_19770 [Flavobacterium akiainvivens]|uniref:Uncharacterized protein n=1 Tax=Flavobacterium akiainvivens TaxID=1202724 RepID=A0A0M8MLK5_9FLAO|nr:hypothetical protein [Flavobacterium akiainvivens]KOS08038.1 hypothetical protein AM493_19770 [Flavobacterium akiainvivens]SFQ62245.1 hypothetical protein SAMN05444144_11099 [Flavobacterium akiainvivens]
MKILLLCFLIFAKMQAQDAAQFTFGFGSDHKLYEWNRSQADIFGFEPVELSLADYTFRLTWCFNSVVLYKNQGKYYGWAKTYIINSNKPEETFGMTYTVDSVTVKSLIALVDSTNIRQIPTDNLIKGWPDGFDGTGYTIEEKHNGSYTYKNYWSPASHNFTEAQTIALFVERFEEIGNFYNLTKPVYELRPFRYYRVGCGVAGIKILTKTESKKEDRRYALRRQNYEAIQQREAALKPK